MSRIMAILPAVYDDLLAARRELIEAARSMSPAERAEGRAELLAASRTYYTPDASHPLALDVDADGIAHVPVAGVLTPSANPCAALDASAQTEYGFIRAALAQAAADPTVIETALEIDSPGGDVNGLDVTAQAIADHPKPITAHVHSAAASAAYYLASQADRIVASSPLSQVGSIGIVYEEVDKSGADAQEGIVRHTIVSSAAPDKRPDLSTKEGRSTIQREVDALHSVFVRRVSEGRHVSPDKVNSDFGKGGILTAEAAQRAGMIDEVRGSHLSRPALSAGVAGSAAVASAAAISPEEVPMDLNLDTLKAEHPAIYAQALDEGKAVGKAEGIKEERARREALLKFKGQNPAVDKAVEAAVREGKTYEEALPEITAAAVFSGAGENAPDVASKAPGSASGADGLTADDIAAARLVGMTLEDYKRFSAKEE